MILFPRYVVQYQKSTILISLKWNILEEESKVSQEIK